MMKLAVKVKPNSKQQKIVEEADGGLTIFLKSPPIDGKANRELIQLLAAHLGVSKSAITIKVGQAGRQKIIEVAD
jgi:uncharacterized protein|nr:DUF167 domain-containing protein [Limnothrix sp. FACHB-1083]